MRDACRFPADNALDSFEVMLRVIYTNITKINIASTVKKIENLGAKVYICKFALTYYTCHTVKSQPSLIPRVLILHM